MEIVQEENVDDHKRIVELDEDDEDKGNDGKAEKLLEGPVPVQMGTEATAYNIMSLTYIYILKKVAAKKSKLLHKLDKLGKFVLQFK